MQSKKRLSEIDVAKGIGIIIVLIGHLQTNYLIKNLIYSFHIPFFFFLAGTVFYRSGKEFKKSCHYVKFYFFYGFFFIILNFIKLKDFDVNLVLDLLLSNPIYIYNIEWFGVFWYYLAYVLISEIVKIDLFRSVTFSLFIFGLLFFIISNVEIGSKLVYLPFCLSPALALLFYYNIGKYYNEILKLYSTFNFYVVTFLFFFLNLTSIKLNEGYTKKIYNFGIIDFDVGFFSLLIVSLIGIVFCVFLSRFITESSIRITTILVHFGKNTFHYYVWHLLIFSIVHSVMYRATMNASYSELFYFQFIKFLISVLILFLTLSVYHYFKPKQRVS